MFKPPLAFRQKEFEDAVNAHRSGALKAQGAVVELSGDAARLTADGRMYVTQSASHGDLYLFITWIGKGSNLRGYLYQVANGPGSPPRLPDTLELQAPVIFDEADIGLVEVEVEPRSTPGWYAVSRSLD